MKYDRAHHAAFNTNAASEAATKRHTTTRPNGLISDDLRTEGQVVVTARIMSIEKHGAVPLALRGRKSYGTG